VEEILYFLDLSRYARPPPHPAPTLRKRVELARANALEPATESLLDAPMAA